MPVLSILPLLGSAKLSERERDADRNESQLDAEKATASNERAVERARAAQTSGRLTVTGMSEEVAAAGDAGYSALVSIYGPRAQERAGRLRDARTREGLSRRLNPGDLGEPTGFLALDLANRVALVRERLLELDPTEAAIVLRDAHGESGNPPDLVTCFAVDHLPRVLKDRLALASKLDLDKLRERLLEKLNPAGAASVATLVALCTRSLYDANAAREALERALNISGGEGRMRVDEALRPLRDVLRVA